MRDRILHLADLHLGERHEYLGAKATARCAEADGVLARLVALALSPDSRIGGVIIAGDLFDRHDPPHTLIESTISQLTSLTQAGIHLLTVPGNHDEYSYPDSVYRRYATRWPGTLVTLPKTTRVATWNFGSGAIDLYAMAYVAGRSKPPYDEIALEAGEIGADAARAICVLHASLDANWSDRSIPLTSGKLARSGFDYVALGHIHKPMERRLGPGWIAYPGRIEGGSFDDPGGAPLLVLETHGLGITPTRAPFESRRIETITMDLSGLISADELDSRLEALAREDGGRILRVRLLGLAAFPVDLERLGVRWGGWFYHLELEDASLGAAASDGELDRWAEARTVRGGFVRRAQAEIAGAATEDEQMARTAALRFGLAAFRGDGAETADVAGATEVLP